MKIGLIADVQYCDCDNDYNYEKTNERFYRNSLNQLDKSLKYFQSKRVEHILQLGDLIDGRCKRYQNFDLAKELIGKRFDNDKFETFHVIGNHELYNFSREEFVDSFLGKSLRKYRSKTTMSDQSSWNYYRVDLSERVSVIVIDTYEISVLNRWRDSGNEDVERGMRDCEVAMAILRDKNGNECWNDPIGAKEARFVAFNGAVGETQLRWLEDELADCERAGRTVLIAGHIPIVNKVMNPLCLVWNSEKVVEILNRFPCVKAYICGHEHDHSIVRTNHFVQITMPGIIESKPDEDPFGIIEIFEHQISISDMNYYWSNDLVIKF